VALSMIIAMVRIRLCLVAAAVLLALSQLRVAAMYIRPDLEVIPVDRLIENLTRLVAREPDDAQLRLNLARAHAMAFATNSEPVQVQRGREEYGVFFGFSPPAVPFTTPGSQTRTSAAMAHLAAAIAEYEKVAAREPADPRDPTAMIARLGLAWGLQQAGERAKAVAAYRAIVRDAWPREQRNGSYNPLGTSITKETIGYLRPLLDPVADGDELERLDAIMRDESRLGRAVTPIVIPLRSGMSVDDLLDRTHRVSFDADGSALDRRWTWISRDAGWLVFDRRGTGRITSALQLFGSVTFWMFWNNGYEPLRALDDDQDGTLRGKELAGLAIWQDVNANGVSEPGEVRSVGEWGIVAVSCAHVVEDESDVFVASSPTGVTFADGTTRPTYDVLLRSLY
jgi:hypothetical protein